MRVLAGASELAGLVMAVRARVDDLGLKRAVLGYIEAFPVALKVNLLQSEKLLGQIVHF